MLPIFAFANKLVYTFLSGCAAPEPWPVPQPAPCYPFGTPVGTHVLSLPCRQIGQESALCWCQTESK